MLVLLGAMLLISAIFRISIPVFSILFAVFLVYLGLRLLVGRRHGMWRGDWFEHRHMEDVRPGDRHEVVFGNSSLDLGSVVIQNETVKTEVSVVFGSSQVYVNRNMPVKILANVAFGSARLPDGDSSAFGEYAWKSPNLDESKPHLELYVNVVFGSARIYAR